MPYQGFRVEEGKIIPEDDQTFRERELKALEQVSVPPVIFKCLECDKCCGVDEISVRNHWLAAHEMAKQEKISEEEDKSEHTENSAKNRNKDPANGDNSGGVGEKWFPATASEQEPTNDCSIEYSDVILRQMKQEVDYGKSPYSLDSGFSSTEYCDWKEKDGDLLADNSEQHLIRTCNISEPPDQITASDADCSQGSLERNQSIFPIGADLLGSSSTAEYSRFDEPIMPVLSPQQYLPSHDVCSENADEDEELDDEDEEMGDEDEEMGDEDEEMDDEDESNSCCSSSSVEHQVSEEEEPNQWNSQRDHEYLSKLNLPKRNQEIHPTTSSSSLYEARRQGKKLWWCKVCDNYFKNPENLKAHVKIHKVDSCMINRYNIATWDLEIARTFNTPHEVELEEDDISMSQT